MEYIGLQSIKNSYATTLASDGENEKAARIINSKNIDPIFNGFSVHPDDEPELLALNTALGDISLDIQALQHEMASAATNFLGLMSTAKIQLESVDEQLTAEEDRIKDMNVICGNINEFYSIKTFSQKDFTGQFGIEKGNTYTASKVSAQPVNLAVQQVAGNGYEGNAYVYRNNAFVQSSLDTSSRDNMTDDSDVTVYEYSRLTASKEDAYPVDVNFDNEEAECGIVIMGDNIFSALSLNSDQEDIIVQDVLTSQDHGASFVSCLKNPIAINNPDEKYKNYDYAYKSNVLAFPSTQYVKLILKSGGTTSDTLAFTQVDTSDAKNPVKKNIELNNTKRHSIRINGIKAFASQYGEGAQFSTGELITTPVNSIAIFGNEYVPPHYPGTQNYFQYILTVNGIGYEIIPINSNRDGVKVIRCSEYSAADDYAIHINESIKSAVLSVVIKNPDESSTPYLSNLKLCLGKAEEK